MVYHFISGNPETVGEDEFVAFVQERFEDMDFMQRASESLRQFDEESCGTLTRDKMKVILTQRGQSPEKVFSRLNGISSADPESFVRGGGVGVQL